MRTTDNPWPDPIKPFGEKVEPQKPRDPEWKPYRDREGVPHQGVEVNSEGKIRTAIPLPKYPRVFP
jgi:hypothetical protein